MQVDGLGLSGRGASVAYLGGSKSLSASRDLLGYYGRVAQCTLMSRLIWRYCTEYYERVDSNDAIIVDVTQAD